jgi:hypothetical protein
MEMEDHLHDVRVPPLQRGNDEEMVAVFPASGDLSDLQKDNVRELRPPAPSLTC